MKKEERSVQRKAEQAIVRAAVRLHYWFMQPMDRDDRNKRPFNKAFDDLLSACNRYRGALGKKPPSPRTALSRIERS